MKIIKILGTRGIPGGHGGFETFAERLAIFLRDSGWRVIVYCQIENSNFFSRDHWDGIERVNICVGQVNSFTSILFDFLSTVHAVLSKGIFLTLGYNTAIFSIVPRLFGVINIINMDGIEWKRKKWGIFAKIWFWLNEKLGCWLGNHLIADHPEISRHLEKYVCSNKITTIAYGADCVQESPTSLILKFGLVGKDYCTIIARPEPENSIVEIVTAYSAKPRGFKLVVLGKYDLSNPYHKSVIEVAGVGVLFLGAIYDKEILSSLRFNSLFYIHGHQVGGTNPSLVEALGAGNAIVAHDNVYNRWVAGASALYFSDDKSLIKIFDEIDAGQCALSELQNNARVQFSRYYRWDSILSKYSKLLSDWYK